MDSVGQARADTSVQPLSASVVVVRPKKPRRYKLLSKQRLKIPNPFPKKYEYTKHMPLVNIDTEDEDRLVTQTTSFIERIHWNYSNVIIFASFIDFIYMYSRRIYVC
ncbi:hypothetical protein PHET_11650 [Paragonimus heterotremus]|uniref:Uncharacterized protein n=1 Tax=Paragonimus heterotremus TaxID=100268 RepID=A0A8J4SKT3_9TREM|nr:hypothetical protein PHET_11650 [Paragonimus heterotremus]